MLAANLALTLTAVVWGSMIPVFNHLLETWDPYFLSAFRYGVGAPLFYLALYLVERRVAAPAGVPRWRLWLLGLAGYGIFAPFYTMGVGLTSPVIAAILTALGPVVAAAVAWLAFRVPIDRAKVPGMALAVIGGIVATYDPSNAERPFNLRGGEILILIATAAWAWYSIAAQSWLGAVSQLRITATTMLPGAVILLVVYLSAAALGVIDDVPALPRTALDIGLFAWMTLLSAGLAVLCWNFGVRRVGIVVSSLYMNVAPIIAVAITAALGTEPTWWQIGGGGLVIIGVAHTQLRRAP